MSYVAVNKASYFIGKQPLLDNIEISIQKGDRISLIGKNGAGKSTLLKILAGHLFFDKGNYYKQPGIIAYYLSQETPYPQSCSIEHYLVQEKGIPEYRCRQLLHALNLIPDHILKNLSGGERKKLSLAETFSAPCDLLLLDEPTNHLDLQTIEWLEAELKSFQGAYVVISHDRAFLSNISRKTLWIDKGTCHTINKGYADFEEYKSQIEQEQERALEKVNATLKLEEHWLQRGVTARRKRNQGRLEKLLQTRAMKGKLLGEKTKDLKAISSNPTFSNQIIIEATNISKTFGERTVIENFSTKILKKDRIGIIGPNGAGKSTLIKILTNEISPDTGLVKVGESIIPSIFDQNRNILDPSKTVRSNIADGDYVKINEQNQHVHSYLKGFHFDENKINSSINALSGGERNRLALAKVLSQTSNFLILDEPTNDLDMETLDFLIDYFDSYEGTLLVVSHDRDFLEQVVNSIIVFDGQGSIQEFVGGYQDYLVQSARINQNRDMPKAQPKLDKLKEKQQAQEKQIKSLTYGEEIELKKLTQEIGKLKEKLKQIQNDIDLAFGQNKGFEEIDPLTKQYQEVNQSLNQKEERWLELELKKDA